LDFLRDYHVAKSIFGFGGRCLRAISPRWESGFPGLCLGLFFLVPTRLRLFFCSVSAFLSGSAVRRLFFRTKNTKRHGTWKLPRHVSRWVCGVRGGFRFYTGFDFGEAGVVRGLLFRAYQIWRAKRATQDLAFRPSLD